MLIMTDDKIAFDGSNFHGSLSALSRDSSFPWYLKIIQRISFEMKGVSAHSVEKKSWYQYFFYKNYGCTVQLRVQISTHISSISLLCHLISLRRTSIYFNVIIIQPPKNEWNPLRSHTPSEWHCCWPSVWSIYIVASMSSCMPRVCLCLQTLPF